MIHGGLPHLVPVAACTVHDTVCDTVYFPCPISGFPTFSLCPRPCPAAPAPLVSGLGVAWCVGEGVWWVGGGGASIGPRRPALPLAGADVCTRRQGVRLLYGPSICTRLVQMELRRS